VSTASRHELLRAHHELLRFVLTKTEDPEVKARQKLVAKVYVDMTPEVKDEITAEAHDEGIKQGRMAEARAALQRVLSRRKLALSADDQARIDTCSELATLERWLDQAVDAVSAAEALR